jgi:hypothetical protein
MLQLLCPVINSKRNMQRLACKKFITFQFRVDKVTSRHGFETRHLSSLSSTRLLKSPPIRSKILSTRTMTTRDTTLQSDIAKMKTEKDGSFKRADASFRNTIAKGSRFEPEHGWVSVLLPIVFCPEILPYLDRYHLYVSYACRMSYLCPWALAKLCQLTYFTAWATRTLIVRKLKGLESIIRRCSWSTSFPKT